MIIGLDDTDSKDGMCTTYLMSVLIKQLKNYGKIRGYPLLIRLNPNIKYKTRGNAALAVCIDTRKGEVGKIIGLVTETVEKMAVFSDDNTNPGIVFIDQTSENMKNDLSMFSLRAVRDILEIHEAKSLLGRHKIIHRGYKNERGLIGALAAAGFAICGLPDNTLELIAYREKERWGSLREIDEESVWRAHAATYPDTWDTVDIENNRIVFAPHSPDPVLFGIRGQSEEAVRRAFALIKSEPVESYIVFRTNQNTDMHLIRACIHEVKEDRSYILRGIVDRAPVTIAGGHIIFGLSENGSCIECAAFEPTKGFRHVIRGLKEGDEVCVFGSVKDNTLNLEKIRIIRLKKHDLRNPVCCGKRMKSMGKGQGKRCDKCGTIEKNMVLDKVDRTIRPGFYEVPPSARRHLSKPLVRY